MHGYNPPKTFAQRFLIELGWTLAGLVACAAIAFFVMTHLSPQAQDQFDQAFPHAKAEREAENQRKIQAVAQQRESQAERAAQERAAVAAANAKANRLPALNDAPSDYPTTFWGRIGYKFHQWWGRSGRNGMQQ